MAKINLPIQEDAPIAAQTGSLLDTNRLGAYAETTSKMAAQTADITMSQYDKAKTLADRAELVAIEAENNGRLSKTLPEAMKQIGGIITNTTNTIAALDQKEFDMALKEAEKAYEVEGMTNLKIGWAQKKAELMGNPKAATEATSWVNDQIATLIENAPSKELALKIYQKTAGMKVDAVKTGLRMRDAAVYQESQHKYRKSYHRVKKAVEDNPYGADEVLTTLPEIAKGGATGPNGVVNKEVEKKLTFDLGGDILSTQVSSFLKKKDHQSAISALADQQYQKMIPQMQLKQLSKDAIDQYVDESVKMNMAAKQAAESKILNNNEFFLTSSQRNKRDNGAFQNFALQILPESKDISKDNFLNVTQQMTAYWKTAQVGVGNIQDDFLKNKAKYSNNPYEAAGYLLALNALKEDPVYKNKFSQIEAGLLKGTDGRLMLNMARDVAAGMRSGEDPSTIIPRVRDFYLNRSDDVNELNKATMKDNLKKINIQQEVDNVFRETFFQKMINGDTGAEYSGLDRQNQIHLESKFRESYMSNYVLSGNHEKAMDMARSELQLGYGVTTINGKKQIMEAPPEKLFGSYLPKVKEQIAEAVKFYELGDTQYEIRSIPGVTANQEGQYTYGLYQPGTDNLIQLPGGGFAALSVGVDKSEYDRILDKEMQKLEREGRLYRDNKKLMEAKLYQDPRTKVILDKNLSLEERMKLMEELERKYG